MKRLYQDCGWKDQSIYKCNTCDIKISVNGRVDSTTMNYKKAFPLIESHIRENHPEVCFICCKCKQFHISIGNLKKCCKNSPL